MIKKVRQKRVKCLIAEAVRLLCEKELHEHYRNDITIQGLLGITLDSKDIVLIDINEMVAGEMSTQDKEKGKILNVKDEPIVSQILEKVTAQSTQENNGTLNSRIRRLLNTSTSDEETIQSVSDSENIENPNTVNSLPEGATEKAKLEHVKSIDIKQPIVVTRTKSALKLSQSLLKQSRGRRNNNTPKCQKPQVCYQCGITTKNMYGLKNHLATVHNEGARYKCNVCNKGFLQRQSYEDHLNAHSGKKTYHCPVCGKSTPFATSMRRHMRHHRLNHDAEEAPRPFQCNQCQSKFKTELSLREHVNIEHLDRRIRCGCGQQFKWRSAFARHKAKCLLAQYSVTDPNPQQKRRKVKHKAALAAVVTPNKETCLKDAKEESVTKTDQSSRTVSNSPLQDVVVNTSTVNVNNLQTATSDVRQPQVARLQKGLSVISETTASLQKYAEQLNKNKPMPPAALAGQGLSMDVGFNQYSQTQQVTSQNLSHGNSVKCSNSTNQNSTVSFQLITATNAQIVAEQPQTLGYVTQQLVPDQNMLQLQPSSVSQSPLCPGGTSISQVIPPAGNLSLPQQFAPAKVVQSVGQFSSTGKGTPNTRAANENLQ